MGVWPVPSLACSSAPPPEADPAVAPVDRSAALGEKAQQPQEGLTQRPQERVPQQQQEGLTQQSQEGLSHVQW